MVKRFCRIAHLSEYSHLTFKHSLAVDRDKIQIPSTAGRKNTAFFPNVSSWNHMEICLYIYIHSFVYGLFLSHPGDNRFILFEFGTCEAVVRINFDGGLARIGWIFFGKGGNLIYIIFKLNVFIITRKNYLIICKSRTSKTSSKSRSNSI